MLGRKIVLGSSRYSSKSNFCWPENIDSISIALLIFFVVFQSKETVTSLVQMEKAPSQVNNQNSDLRDTFMIVYTDSK